MSEPRSAGRIAQSTTVSTGVDICGTLSCDRSDFGFKVFGGYMFTPYFGAELRYANYRQSKLAHRARRTTANVESAGFGAFLIGQYPVDNFRIFGKIGFAYLDTEVSASAVGFGSAVRFGQSHQLRLGPRGRLHVQQEPRRTQEYEQATIRALRRERQREFVVDWRAIQLLIAAMTQDNGPSGPLSLVGDNPGMSPAPSSRSASSSGAPPGTRSRCNWPPRRPRSAWPCDSPSRPS